MKTAEEWQRLLAGGSWLNHSSDTRRLRMLLRPSPYSRTSASVQRRRVWEGIRIARRAQ